MGLLNSNAVYFVSVIIGCGCKQWKILLTVVKTNRNVFILHSLKKKQRLAAAAAAAAVWSATQWCQGPCLLKSLYHSLIIWNDCSSSGSGHPVFLKGICETGKSEASCVCVLLSRKLMPPRNQHRSLSLRSQWKELLAWQPLDIFKVTEMVIMIGLVTHVLLPKDGYTLPQTKLGHS